MKPTTRIATTVTRSESIPPEEAFEGRGSRTPWSLTPEPAPPEVPTPAPQRLVTVSARSVLPYARTVRVPACLHRVRFVTVRCKRETARCRVFPFPARCHS